MTSAMGGGREGPSKADVVMKISKGGCVKQRIWGEGDSKIPKSSFKYRARAQDDAQEMEGN